LIDASFAPAAWVAAFARSSAFAASVPLGGSGAVPKAVRAVLALTLTPAIVPYVSVVDRGRFPEAALVADAIVGAAFGLSAALIAAAAASAGSLIDATLASTAVIGREAVFGSGGGPIARLYSLAFAAAFFGSGAMTHLCERFVMASSDAAIAPTLQGAIELVRACCDASIGLAAPAIVAQLLGTIVAAASARAAPRINGLMLSSPLVTALALLSLLAAAPSTIAHLIALARAAATTPAL
jgi:flagellar biosynthesis protein FliR